MPYGPFRGRWLQGRLGYCIRGKVIPTAVIWRDSGASAFKGGGGRSASPTLRPSDWKSEGQGFECLTDCGLAGWLDSERIAIGLLSEADMGAWP